MDREGDCEGGTDIRDEESRLARGKQTNDGALTYVSYSLPDGQLGGHSRKLHLGACRCISEHLVHPTPSRSISVYVPTSEVFPCFCALCGLATGELSPSLPNAKFPTGYSGRRFPMLDTPAEASAGSALTRLMPLVRPEHPAGGHIDRCIRHSGRVTGSGGSGAYKKSQLPFAGVPAVGPEAPAHCLLSTGRSGRICR